MKLYAYVFGDWRGIPVGTYYRSRKQAADDPCAKAPNFRLVSFNVRRIKDGAP